MYWRSSSRVRSGFGAGEAIGSGICQLFYNSGIFGKATEQLKDFSRLHRWAKHDFFELLLPTMKSAAAPAPGIGERLYYRRGLHIANLALLDDLHGKPHIIAFLVKGDVSSKAMFEHFG